MKAEGEYELYHTTPVEAWSTFEKAQEALEGYKQKPLILPKEDWKRLYNEVNAYESLKKKSIFKSYIEGILFLHKEFDTPEFREILEQSFLFYTRIQNPDYFLVPVEFKN